MTAVRPPGRHSRESMSRTPVRGGNPPPSRIVVTGTIGLDTVETPFGKVEAALGGSASYFALAAALYSPVSIVSVVGEDFPARYQELLTRCRPHGSAPIDLMSVARLPGRTFRWGGRYHYDLNTRDTLFTDLNVLTEFRPVLQEAERTAPYVFLANIDPVLQAQVLDQVRQPRLTMLDTMNLWIEHSRAALTEVLRRVDVVLVNDEEAREYTGEYSVFKAARTIRALGPRIVIVKRGEYGAVLVGDGGTTPDAHHHRAREEYFFLPGYPLEDPRDPTGAGDSFAGGFLGYLASVDMTLPDAGGAVPARHPSMVSIRRALVHASVVASFAVEQFGVQALVELTREQVRARFREFKRLTHFDE